jgi:hypothetical protein
VSSSKYIPTLEEVAEKWKAMATHLADDLGCIFRVERGPYGWSCSIHDPAMEGGPNIARKATPEEAMREAVSRWEDMSEALLKSRAPELL